MSHHWLMNTSFAYNSTIVNNGFAGAFANDRCPGGPDQPGDIATASSTDYLTAGSGLGNVYVNAKWLFKLSGLYNLPVDVNVSAFYNARQGYPFEAFVQRHRPRPNGARHRDHPARPVGDNRLPNYQNLDFHVDRPVKFGTLALHAVARRVQRDEQQHDSGACGRTQNATNANQIRPIMAPRVLRFGIRVNW